MRQAVKPTYMATMLAGLEDIVADEIGAKIEDSHIQQTQRGKIFFTSARPLPELTRLRAIDNLYIYISSFTMGPHRVHLMDLEKEMSRIDLSGAVEGKLLSRQGVTFVVNSSRAGKHTYSRFEMSDAAARGLLRQLPGWRQGTAGEHQLEFRLDLSGEQAIFSLRLTDASFRYRSHERLFSQASLRPSVAHALVWLSKPQDDDYFVDPFCGSGTILAERASYPFRVLTGGDVSAEAAAVARRNIGNAKVAVHEWDARELPLDASSVDTVVSNLPFGEQILLPEEIAELYLRFAKQLSRILIPDGRAILLTNKEEELAAACDRLNLPCYKLYEISLKGLHPSIFEIRKN
jgi:tRNA (guanine6-N2)-methyltransferase